MRIGGKVAAAVAVALLCGTAPAGEPAAPRPNIVLILSDDMGFSDLGCYGGEIATPNLDALAANGVRFTQFYNTARCCPTRASLLTGLYPHQAGVGHMLGELIGKADHDAWKSITTVGDAAIKVAGSIDKYMTAVAGLGTLEALASFSTVVMTGNIIGAVLSVFSLFSDSSSKPEHMVMQEIGKLRQQVDKLRTEMRQAAADLEFERAAALRDKARELEQLELQMR